MGTAGSLAIQKVVYELIEEQDTQASQRVIKSTILTSSEQNQPEVKRLENKPIIQRWREILTANPKIWIGSLTLGVTLAGTVALITAWVWNVEHTKPLLAPEQPSLTSEQPSLTSEQPSLTSEQKPLPVCHWTEEPMPRRGLTPKKGVLVMIDPGHGIPPDTGRIGINGLSEEDVVLPISKKIAEILAKNGVRTVLTRNADCVLKGSVTSSLQYRTQTADLVGATLFVSIHAYTTSPMPMMKGLETYADERSIRLAQVVHNSILQNITSWTDRKVRSGENLYLIKNNSVPTILIETGSLTNKEDAARLRNPEYQNKMAEGTARGILQYIQQQN